MLTPTTARKPTVAMATMRVTERTITMCARFRTERLLRAGSCGRSKASSGERGKANLPGFCAHARGCAAALIDAYGREMVPPYERGTEGRTRSIAGGIIAPADAHLCRHSPITLTDEPERTLGRRRRTATPRAAPAASRRCCDCA